MTQLDMFDIDETPPVMATWLGGWMHPTALTPDEVFIENIAHGLSCECRNGGQSPLYFVAQHSLNVSNIVAQKTPDNFKRRLAALLHDAPEGLGLKDIPSQVKPTFLGYKRTENRALKAVFEAFGILDEYPLHEDIDEADHLAWKWEQRDLMPLAFNESSEKVPETLHLYPKLIPMSQRQAEETFLKEFEYLMDRIQNG